MEIKAQAKRRDVWEAERRALTAEIERTEISTEDGAMLLKMADAIRQRVYDTTSDQKRKLLDTRLRRSFS